MAIWTFTGSNWADGGKHLCCSVNDAILRFLSGVTVEDDVKVYEPEHKQKSVPADIDMQMTQRISPVVAAIADEIEAAVAKETV